MTGERSSGAVWCFLPENNFRSQVRVEKLEEKRGGHGGKPLVVFS